MSAYQKSKMSNLADSGYKIRDQHGLYYLTMTVVAWVDLFTRENCKEIVIASLKYCQEHKGLEVYSYVIMPSHLHLILRAHENSKGLSSIVRDFKKYTSKRLWNYITTSKKESRREWLQMMFKYHARFNSKNKIYQIWQQKNHPVLLLHPRFTLQKLNYIHQNPVTDGIVNLPEDYKYSSASNYIYAENNVLQVSIIDFGVIEGYLSI